MSASTQPEPRDRTALIVLAAGAGTRMKSSLPKPLHPVAGVPMLTHVLNAGGAVDPAVRIVVLSPAIAHDPAWTSAGFDVAVAMQDPPLGTAHAVSSALPSVPDEIDWLLVLFADHPLLTGETVLRLLSHAKASRALVTILTCSAPEPGAYARIKRDKKQRVTRIIERKDDDPTKRTNGMEINSGMMVLDARWARRTLPLIPASPATGEFYLTDLVRIAVEERQPKERWPVEAAPGEHDDLLGVNDRIEQAAAEHILRDRIRREHMRSGVTLIMPETISIDRDVAIGQDTTIRPFTILETGTKIGSHCSIGPFTTIRNSEIGDHVEVRASTVTDSRIEQGSDAGPYAHLRRGSDVGPDVHIGNFAEIKQSRIERGARVGHMSYLGDATIGERTNIGAGTVTCNFDGERKHRTIVGAGAFIGSDTMLVAPVEVGPGAKTGAGAVVIADVPAGELVAGVPAKPLAKRVKTEASTKSEGDA